MTNSVTTAKKLAVPHKNMIAFCACYIMFVEYINYFAHTFFKLLGFGIPYLTQIVLLFGLTMLAFVFFNNSRRRFSSLIFPLIILLLTCMTYLRLEDNAHYFTESALEKLFLYCIPAYIAVYLIDDFQSLNKMLQKFSVFLLAVEILTVILMTTNSSAFVQTDYQGISYGLLIPLIFWICKNDRTKFETLCLFVAFFIMIFFGGRGPLVCALLCILYKMFQVPRRPLLMILFFLTSVFLVFFYQDIIQWVIDISSKYGFSGSIAKYYEMGDVFMLSGRDDIRQNASEIIKNHPLLGVGMGGTRYWLGEYGFKYGNYPHNILYEFLCDYGVIFGSTLFAMLCFFCIRIFLKRNKNKEAYTLFEICFFSTGFLVLMFSSSYLLCPLFFAMIALIPRFLVSKLEQPLNNEVKESRAR